RAKIFERREFGIGKADLCRFERKPRIGAVHDELCGVPDAFAFGHDRERTAAAVGTWFSSGPKVLCNAVYVPDGNVAMCRPAFSLVFGGGAGQTTKGGSDLLSSFCPNHLLWHIVQGEYGAVRRAVPNRVDQRRLS